MPLDLLIQETRGMSEEAIMEIVRFTRFMKLETMIVPFGEDGKKADNGKPILRQAGLLKGQIRLSDDFDAPLEDFREYM